MRHRVSRPIAHGVASALVLMFLITSAAADDSDVDNVAACNGKAGVSPDLQIEGCTALTKSADNPKVLAIIYNNRGNAYVAKGQYDLAIADYGEALKDDPQYARAFNNRGVAYQKKAEYDLAIQDFDAALKLNPNYANAIANRAETYREKGRLRKRRERSRRRNPAAAEFGRAVERAVLDARRGGRLAGGIERLQCGNSIDDDRRFAV